MGEYMSILPGLKRDEAVIMLQKTATCTSINSVSEVNGAGVLNHYKMLRVAQRLHAAGFNEADRAQRLALLKDEKHYDFAREATGLQAEADAGR